MTIATTSIDTAPAIRELTMEEMAWVAGGVDWQEVGEGLAIAGGALLAIAALPEAALVGAAYAAALAGSAASGAAAGALIGDGLSK